MAYTRDEMQAAFDTMGAASTYGGATGDWKPWTECYTPDVEYVEHHYGNFHGRAEILAWITETMTQWPFSHMREFPWDWTTFDTGQGFIVGQVENRFVDPGDGVVYQAANWTRLVYAGDGLFSSEEDVYNPMDFAPVIQSWLEAWAKHHPDKPTG